MDSALYVTILMHNLLFPDLHPETSLSAVHCVNTCFYNRTCASLFYDNNRNLCYQSNTWFNDRVAGLTTRPGITYYIFHRGDCTDGWVYHKPTNKCFSLLAVQKTNLDAKRACSGLSGRLFNIYSAEQNDLVYTVVKRRGKDIWIGINQGQGFWRWHEGQAPVFFYWSRSPGTYNCVVFSTGTKKWLSVKCGELHWYMCEIVVPEICNQG
ncbi:snaclec coagulation factor IX-binding protein subunit A-like [Haliotis asinina]|uniref:snaclec coagulation factor IX-binding protein subunit A-like n=1 Tax=Haliotis asinina TaxID=109174 RepID=UPI0035325888